MSDDPLPDKFCGNCCHFSDEHFECRRHAPRPADRGRLEYSEHSLLDAQMLRWPHVEPREWCGEFEPSDEPPEGGWIVQGQRHPLDADPRPD